MLIAAGRTHVIIAGNGVKALQEIAFQEINDQKVSAKEDCALANRPFPESKVPLLPNIRKENGQENGQGKHYRSLAQESQHQSQGQKESMAKRVL